MTDQEVEVRALLAAVVEDLPPTRLTVDGICAEGRRRIRVRIAPRTGRPSPRLMLRVTAAAAAVLVVPGLVVALLLAGGAAVGNSGAAGRTTASPVRGEEPVTGVVRLSSDDRTLTLKATGGCDSGFPMLRVARQGPNVVVLRLQPGTPSGLPSGARCGLAATVGTVSVRLDQPLGSRQVRAIDGHVLAVLDPRKAARVTYWPPDYHGTGSCTEPDGGTVAACSANRERLLPGLSLLLTVRQVFGSVSIDSGHDYLYDPPSPVTVHGLSAQLRLGRRVGKLAGQIWFIRTLTWSEHGETIVISTSNADRLSLLVPTAGLVQVGNGLRW